MARKTIMICDDDPDLRRSVRLLLGGAFDVVEAEDGSRALEIIASRPPSLVILDVSLPQRTGLSVLREAKALQPALRILVLTGHRELGIARRALALGAAEFVTKPVEADYLEAAVRRLTDASRNLDSEPCPWRVSGPAPHEGMGES